MLNHSTSLDETFRALADPTRRAILVQLERGPARMSDLARPLPMSLPAVHQHLQLLQRAGLVSWDKRGRERWCRLEDQRLAAAQAWLGQRRMVWKRRLNALEAILKSTE